MKVVTINAPEKKDTKVCKCELRVRAYMRMLRAGEGTTGKSGYTKLFGGGDFTKSPHNKDMSDHPQIKVYWYTQKDGSKVHSSESGAYQVMGYTWNDKDMVKKRKTYDIKDFSPENQDKFCLVLFKYARKGMLDLIIQGKIQEATEKYGSYEWASLPPGRYGQPIKTMKDALSLYDKHYKEEEAGITDLYLKKGFLKDFGYSCDLCGVKPAPKSDTNCSSCNKRHIDLADESKWQTQFSSVFGDRKKQNVACWRACKKTLENYGVNGGGNINPIQMVKQNGASLKLANPLGGVNYLNAQLEKGNPVLVGVDDGRTKTYNSDGTTEHFIVIVGRACSENQMYYRYFEVGTAHKNKGVNINNRLFLQTDNTIKGSSPGGTKIYTIAQVRRNK